MHVTKGGCPLFIGHAVVTEFVLRRRIGHLYHLARECGFQNTHADLDQDRMRFLINTKCGFQNTHADLYQDRMRFLINPKCGFQKRHAGFRLRIRVCDVHKDSFDKVAAP